MIRGAIEVGGFLFWVDDIEYVQTSEDATGGHYVKIVLKSGTELRVDAYSDEVDKLKSKIHHAMIEAQNTKDGDTK